MKKRLLIIGAGNVGGFLSYNIGSFGNYEVIGFLDDDAAKQGKEFYGRKVVGNVDDITNYLASDPLYAVIGISSPRAKAVIEGKLASLPIQYPNFIAEGVWISKQVTLGKGIILYPGTTINYETAVGDFVITNMNCSIGHNCFLGKYSSLAPGVNLAGFTIIEEGVEMGIGSCTKQNIRIGKYSKVGGQGMIVNDIPENSKVVGVPGKLLVN